MGGWSSGRLAVLGTLTVAALALRVGAAAQAGPPSGALAVRTLTLGEWTEAVAALQQQREAQGRTVWVVVEDALGQRAACGTYRLALDPAGQAAFRPGACDPGTGATPLVLVDRSALFVHGGAVAQPRRVAISALEQRTGLARGGASTPVESELRCTLGVRPYLVDLYRGARVRATPDRFLMRPVGAGVEARVEGDGWLLRAAAVDVEYELVDRATGDVVLRERVALACGRSPLPSAEPAAARIPGIIPLHPGRVFRGATLTRGPDDAGSCGGQAGPEQWYEVRLERPSRLGLRLVSEFDAALYLREGSPTGPELRCHDEPGRLETMEINLPPGAYYVAVDGTGTHGRYRLVAFEEAIDPQVFPPVPRGEVELGGRRQGTLLSAPSHYHGSCGGVQAPEHVYYVRLERPSWVTVRLSSRFDPALYVLRADGSEVGCRRAIGRDARARRVRFGAELPAGLYYVVVDGESAEAGSGPYRLRLDRL